MKLISCRRRAPPYRPFAQKAEAWSGLAHSSTLALAERRADNRRAGPPRDDDPTGCRGSTCLVAGTIANTNGLLVILAKLVAHGVLDKDDLKTFSDSYSKPLDHVGMRENELVSQMQDQMESTLAELMRFLSERERKK